MAQEIHLRVKKGLRKRLIIKVDDVHVCVKKLEYSQFGNVNFMQSNLAFIRRDLERKKRIFQGIWEAIEGNKGMMMTILK